MTWQIPVADPLRDVEPEHSHDPGEVTVQLDVVTVGAAVDAANRLRGNTAADRSAADKPVFVDETGRRSRRLRRIGIGVGTVCALYAGVIVATLVSGHSDAPWLPVPGQQEEAPAAEVQVPTGPTESAAATEPGATPAADASAGGTASARSTSGTSVPSLSAGAVDTGASSDAEPSATRTAAPADTEQTTGATETAQSPTRSPAAEASTDPGSESSPSASPADGGSDSGGTVTDSGL
ncbi:hypothetical protein ABZ490_17280 [Streptomyces sp. NPDC005811]|uniref:hypothetical protein n=1 Tax=Streptomyces sp. NPDC005811 TaxID=3154565 RepID=UPI0033D552B2